MSDHLLWAINYVWVTLCCKRAAMYHATSCYFRPTMYECCPVRCDQPCMSDQLCMSVALLGATSHVWATSSMYECCPVMSDQPCMSNHRQLCISVALLWATEHVWVTITSYVWVLPCYGRQGIYERPPEITLKMSLLTQIPVPNSIRKCVINKKGRYLKYEWWRSGYSHYD